MNAKIIELQDSINENLIRLTMKNNIKLFTILKVYLNQCEVLEHNNTLTGTKEERLLLLGKRYYQAMLKDLADFHEILLGYMEKS